MPSWRERARAIRADVGAVALALRHPRTPWYAKLVAVAVVAYAVSPIDLIPDFIPVLGHLDDVLLVPLGIALVVRLVPPDVLAECRAAAATGRGGAGLRVAGAVLVVLAWIALVALAVALLRPDR